MTREAVDADIRTLSQAAGVKEPILVVRESIMLAVLDERKRLREALSLIAELSLDANSRQIAKEALSPGTVIEGGAIP